MTDDVTGTSLLPVDGALPVLRPEVDETALDRLGAAPRRVAWWETRLAACRALKQDDRP
jgi:O-succinylbenzoate synthase